MIAERLDGFEDQKTKGVLEAFQAWGARETPLLKNFQISNSKIDRG